MTPRMVEFTCPHCKCWNKPIPADMGDKTIKCRVCGLYIHYKYRTVDLKIVKRPERTTASGLTFY